MAGDENYTDPTNLQNKIQKHATFEAEITANSNRLQNIVAKGQDLIDAKHFASSEIKTRLDEVEADWKHLQELSDLKRERLNDAYQALLFNRSMDEFEAWLSQVETLISSGDYGKDLASATNLLKKHQAVENEVQQHTENCENINETAELFVKNNHFMAEQLEERAQGVITRFHKLQGPMQAKRDMLEASLMLQQFLRDADDEMQWLMDRELLAASRDLGESLFLKSLIISLFFNVKCAKTDNFSLGNNLTAVQSLQKKHQALEAELSLREPVVGALVARASTLGRSGHNASSLIEEKAKELKSKLAQLQDLASIRRLRLQDALESHTVKIFIISSLSERFSVF